MKVGINTPRFNPYQSEQVYTQSFRPNSRPNIFWKIFYWKHAMQSLMNELRFSSHVFDHKSHLHAVRGSCIVIWAWLLICFQESLHSSMAVRETSFCLYQRTTYVCIDPLLLSVVCASVPRHDCILQSSSSTWFCQTRIQPEYQGVLATAAWKSAK